MSSSIPRYETPLNKSGLHIVVQGSHNGYEDYLRRCADAGRPVGLIKVMKDGGAAGLAKEVSPKTYTVWRWFGGRDHEDDTPAGNWQWAAADSKKTALKWMSYLYGMWELDRQWVDFYEFLNEPDPADQYGIERAAELVQYCMEDAEAHGFKTAIWSFTSGLPRTPTINPTDFPQAENILYTLKWAAEHGHVLAVHDGSVNEGRRLFRQAYEDKTALRYRYVKALMNQKGWPMPYVVITEAYQPGGYRKPDWADWKWYLTELGRDRYVLGCAWFTLGDYEFSPGQSINVVSQLAGLAELASTMPLPQPDPDPAWSNTVMLRVRYTSQNNPITADLSRNDCGPACCAMIDNYRGHERTVNEWFTATGAGQELITIQKLVNAAATMGYTAEYKAGQSLDALRAAIDAGDPVIALVNAGKLRYCATTSPHFVLVIGYEKGTDTFYIHDPYLIPGGGGGAFISQESFGLAWNSCHLQGNPNGAWLILREGVTPPPPPPAAAALRGLHLRADGPNTEADFECVRIGRIEAAKILTSTPPSDFDRLVALGIRPDRIVMRLFADFRDRIITPSEFCSWMVGPLDWFARKGGRYVEIHNEPNLPQEGLGLSWGGASGFAYWYAAALGILRGMYTTLRFGFPGLSPQPDIGNWLAACSEAIRASDWCGTHSYWTESDQMTHPNHGAHWQSYLMFGKPVLVTEFANVNPHTSKLEKGRQYCEYFAGLPGDKVPMAFAFVSSASAGFTDQTWAEVGGTLSVIPMIVGA